MTTVLACRVQRSAPIVTGLIDVTFVLEEQPHDVKMSFKACDVKWCGLLLPSHVDVTFRIQSHSASGQVPLHCYLPQAPAVLHFDNVAQRGNDGDWLEARADLISFFIRFGDCFDLF